MIRGHRAMGYDEYINDPFPRLMRGNNKYFQDLPYLSPEFRPVLEKGRAILHKMVSDADAVWISRMPQRADADTNFHRSSPRGSGQAHVPEIREGSIVDDNA